MKSLNQRKQELIMTKTKDLSLSEIDIDCSKPDATNLELLHDFFNGDLAWSTIKFLSEMVLSNISQEELEVMKDKLSETIDTVDVILENQDLFVDYVDVLPADSPFNNFQIDIDRYHQKCFLYVSRRSFLEGNVNVSASSVKEFKENQKIEWEKSFSFGEKLKIIIKELKREKFKTNQLLSKTKASVK